MYFGTSQPCKRQPRKFEDVQFNAPLESVKDGCGWNGHMSESIVGGGGLHFSVRQSSSAVLC